MTDKHTGGNPDEWEPHYSEFDNPDDQPTQMFDRVQPPADSSRDGHRDDAREQPADPNGPGPKPPEYHRAEEFQRPDSGYRGAPGGYPPQGGYPAQGRDGYPASAHHPGSYPPAGGPYRNDGPGYAPQPDPRARDYQPSQQRRSGNSGRIAAWVLGIGILLLALFMAGYILLSGDDSSSEDRSSTTRSTAETTTTTTDSTQAPTTESTPETSSNPLPSLPEVPTLPTFEAPTIQPPNPEELPSLPELNLPTELLEQ